MRLFMPSQWIVADCTIGASGVVAVKTLVVEMDLLMLKKVVLSIGRVCATTKSARVFFVDAVRHFMSIQGWTILVSGITTGIFAVIETLACMCFIMYIQNSFRFCGECAPFNITLICYRHRKKWWYKKVIKMISLLWKKSEKLYVKKSLPTQKKCLPTRKKCLPTQKKCLPTQKKCLPTQYYCIRHRKSVFRHRKSVTDATLV